MGTLASMAIDYHFLPTSSSDKACLARPFGSTVAPDETLAAIGGFEAFRLSADDYAMGEGAAGMQVAIPPFIVVHSCTEQSAGEVLRHELRWARTVRAVSPLGYAGSVITHPLPFALLAAWLMGFSALALSVVAASIACRLVLQVQVDHTLQVSMKRWWLGPLRDLMSFIVYVASFFVSVVNWRGDRYTVRADGTLMPIGEPKP